MNQPQREVCPACASSTQKKKVRLRRFLAAQLAEQWSCSAQLRRRGHRCQSDLQAEQLHASQPQREVCHACANSAHEKKIRLQQLPAAPLAEQWSCSAQLRRSGQRCQSDLEAEQLHVNQPQHNVCPASANSAQKTKVLLRRLLSAQLAEQWSGSAQLRRSGHRCRSDQRLLQLHVNQLRFLLGPACASSTQKTRVLLCQFLAAQLAEQWSGSAQPRRSRHRCRSDQQVELLHASQPQREVCPACANSTQKARIVLRQFPAARLAEQWSASAQLGHR